MTKWPTRTCVQARTPPSGGGPGSFQLATLFSRPSLLPFPSSIVAIRESSAVSEENVGLLESLTLVAMMTDGVQMYVLFAPHGSEANVTSNQNQCYGFQCR